MKSFLSFLIEDSLNEKVLSIGLNPNHDAARELHRHEIHDMISHAYTPVGGYLGLGTGSDKESEAIHSDISNSLIKAVKRNGKITSVNMYRKQHGRKSIASATDGTAQGKADFMKSKLEDHEHKRAWGEVSGKMAHISSKIGMPDIPSHRAKELLDKDVTAHDDGVHYDRDIAGKQFTKKMVGHPRK